jgi:hypothetical protein
VKRLVLLMAAALVGSLAVWAVPASGQEPPTTTTTAPPATTTTTALPVELPGEHIQDGSMTIGARFQNKVEFDCQLSGSLTGQQMNLIRTETNNLGAVYGKANLDFGETGMVLAQLGPLPTAVLAYRTTGACNHDIVALGGYASTPTSATFEGIGFGVYPNDFASFVSVSVQVVASGGEPTLDIQAAYDYLNQPRE